MVGEVSEWVRSESKSACHPPKLGVILLCIRCVTESDLNTKAMSWHGLAGWLLRKLREKDGESYVHMGEK